MFSGSALMAACGGEPYSSISEKFTVSHPSISGDCQSKVVNLTSTHAIHKPGAGLEVVKLQDTMLLPQMQSDTGNGTNSLAQPARPEPVIFPIRRWNPLQNINGDNLLWVRALSCVASLEFVSEFGEPGLVQYCTYSRSLTVRLLSCSLELSISLSLIEWH